jgi:hypothetical protein
VGKAWHTWPGPSTAVPVGEPLLPWSLTGDGQADAEDKAQAQEVRAARLAWAG